jgi:hypothetical protein
VYPRGQVYPRYRVYTVDQMYSVGQVCPVGQVYPRGRVYPSGRGPMRASGRGALLLQPRALEANCRTARPKVTSLARRSTRSSQATSTGHLHTCTPDHTGHILDTGHWTLDTGHLPPKCDFKYTRRSGLVSLAIFTNLKHCE